MPIRPEQMKLYPGGGINSPEWLAIRRRIEARAGGSCEKCGVANRALGGRDAEGTFHPAQSKGDNGLRIQWPAPGEEYWCGTNGRSEWLRIIKIVCTVAHVDGKLVDHGDNNLRFWCQRCHLGPLAEPITLAEAREYCGTSVEPRHITAAREAVEDATGRAMLTQKWQEVLDAWPEDLTIKLSRTPLIEVVCRYFRPFPTGHYHDGEEIRQFRIHGHAIVPASIDAESGLVTFPPLARNLAIRPYHAIEISFVAGYGDKAWDVPADMREAVLHRVKYQIDGDGAAQLPEAYFEAIDRNRRAA